MAAACVKSHVPASSQFMWVESRSDVGLRDPLSLAPSRGRGEGDFGGFPVVLEYWIILSDTITPFV